MTDGTASPTPPTGSDRPHRVVVVDDHGMFRAGVKAEIGRAVAVVGEAADAPSAVAVVLDTAPDVVLLDVHLPGGGGVEVLRRVHEKNPDLAGSPSGEASTVASPFKKRPSTPSSDCAQLALPSRSSSGMLTCT